MVVRASRYVLEDYIRAVRLLLSCVTPYVVVPVRHDSHNYLTINYGNSVPLSGSSRFSLRYHQNYAVTGTAAETTGYIYTILDGQQRQVLNYHWHPRGRSRIVAPHLHLKQGARIGQPEIRDAHLPTGYVSLSSFLVFLIRDLNVDPARGDWQSVLSENADL